MRRDLEHLGAVPYPESSQRPPVTTREGGRRPRVSGRPAQVCNGKPSASAPLGVRPGVVCVSAAPRPAPPPPPPPPPPPRPAGAFFAPPPPPPPPPPPTKKKTKKEVHGQTRQDRD